jgi:hypothetical protein
MVGLFRAGIKKQDRWQLKCRHCASHLSVKSELINPNKLKEGHHEKETCFYITGFSAFVCSCCADSRLPRFGKPIY